MGLKIGDFIETSPEGFREPWMLDAVKRYKKPWKVTYVGIDTVEFTDGYGALHAWLHRRIMPIPLENE